MRLEQTVNLNLQRLAQFEETLEVDEKEIQAREEACLAAKQSHSEAEAAMSSRLDLLSREIQLGCLAQDAVEERERAGQARRKELVKCEQRSRRRIERVIETRRQLEFDRGDVAFLKADCKEETRSLAEAREKVLVAQETVHQRQEELDERESELRHRRESALSRHQKLKPLSGSLQAREVELDEREALLESRRKALAERQRQFEVTNVEARAASKKASELHKQNEEAEMRLVRLWDDIYQRQQMLQDINSSIHGREERLSAAQHSFVCQREVNIGSGWEAWNGEDEHVELELMAAELMERAWRERSAFLAQREDELRGINVSFIFSRLPALDDEVSVW